MTPKARYRHLAVSGDTLPDLARALWVAEALNRAEGNVQPNRQSAQAEAFARIVREWSVSALAEFVGVASPWQGREFLAIEGTNWQCARCGSTGLNSGGLTAAGCMACATANSVEAGPHPAR